MSVVTLLHEQIARLRELGETEDAETPRENGSIFSRYIVGWMVADRESSALAGAPDPAAVGLLARSVLTLRPVSDCPPQQQD